jgi:hypothetical protein
MAGRYRYDLGMIGLWRLGQETALQPLGQPALLLVQPGVVQSQSDPVGQIAGGRDVVLVRLRAVCRPVEAQRSQGPVPGRHREGDRRPGCQLPERVAHLSGGQRPADRGADVVHRAQLPGGQGPQDRGVGLQGGQPQLRVPGCRRTQLRVVVPAADVAHPPVGVDETDDHPVTEQGDHGLGHALQGRLLASPAHQGRGEAGRHIGDEPQAGRAAS